MPQVVPPTPTWLPAPGPALVDINENAYRIWRYTDEAIMIWQEVGPSRTQVFQIAILVVIVIAAVYLVYRWISTLIEGYRGTDL